MTNKNVYIMLTFINDIYSSYTQLDWGNIAWCTK